MLWFLNKSENSLKSQCYNKTLFYNTIRGKKINEALTSELTLRI